MDSNIKINYQEVQYARDDLRQVDIHLANEPLQTINQLMADHFTNLQNINFGVLDSIIDSIYLTKVLVILDSLFLGSEDQDYDPCKLLIDIDCHKFHRFTGLTLLLYGLSQF